MGTLCPQPNVALPPKGRLAKLTSPPYLTRGGLAFEALTSSSITAPIRGIFNYTLLSRGSVSLFSLPSNRVPSIRPFLKIPPREGMSLSQRSGLSKSI